MKMRYSGGQTADWLRWANVVSLFFVLSGFILTYVYSSRLKLAKWRFFLARVARLWPAHVTSILLIWLAAPGAFERKFTLGKLAATLAMVHAWVPSPAYWLSFVPAAWSISTEFGFYLCFPFLVYKSERTWLWKLAGSFVLLCGIIVLMEMEQAHLVRWMGRYWSFWLYVHPLSRLFEFVLGMATFELWRRFGPKLNHGLLTITLWECLTLAFCVFTLWQAPAWTDRIITSNFFASELFGLWVLASSACFAGAAFIFVLALERGLIARLLSNPFAVLLGELSYAVYLVHQAVLVFFWMHRKDFAGIPRWATFPIISLTILAIAYLVWAIIERPCRRFLTSLWPAPGNVVAVELPASMIRPIGVVGSRHASIVLPSKCGILIASVSLLVVVMLVTLLRA